MFQLPSPGYVKPPPKSLPFSPNSAGSGVGCMALRWWGRTEEHLIIELQSQSPAYSNGRRPWLVAWACRFFICTLHFSGGHWIIGGVCHCRLTHSAHLIQIVCPGQRDCMLLGYPLWILLLCYEPIIAVNNLERNLAFSLAR